MGFVRFGIAIALVGLAAAGSVSAQAAPKPAQPAPAKEAPSSGARIAFINAGALLKGMPGYAQAESTWTKEAETAQTEAQKLRAVFDSAVATYQQGQAMMTPTNRTAKEKELQAKQDTLQGKLQALQTRVQTRERDLLGPLQERLKAIIDGIRAEGNYVMIIDLSNDASSGIVAYDKAADITLRVATRLSQSN